MVIAAAVFVLFFLNSSDRDARNINMDEVGFFQYHNHFNPERLLISNRGEITQPEHSPVMVEGVLYLPVDFLRANVDRYIFWEPASNRLSITNYTQVKRFVPDVFSYTINGREQVELSRPIIRIGDMAYMAADVVTLFYADVSFMLYGEYGIVTGGRNRDAIIYRVELLGEGGEDLWTPLRFGASQSYPIMARVEQGQQVEFFYEHGDFYFVGLENGLSGYALARDLAFHDMIVAYHHLTPPRPPQTRPSFDGPINMIWHLVTSPAAAANPDNRYTMQGINVISPTWLYFCRPSMDGTIINFGNREYVQWAHANGMDVWPMISDAFFSPVGGPEVFSNEAARFALVDADRRDFIIEQIMDMVIRYGWDGVNIDYEAVQPPEADYFIQFLRELAIPMREAGAVLSVAVFSPIPSNRWWNYPEIGRASDFLAIMAYDEHYRTINRPGSVSSFPFVEDAVVNMISLGVRPDQIILGLPTYMRVWTEQWNIETGQWQLLPGGPEGQPLPEFYPHRRVMDVGMQFGRNIMTNLGGEFVWDNHLRQYVSIVYFNHNGIEMRTSAWLNDLSSTGEKLSLYHQHDLAGIAWWRKGLGLPAMWQFVDEVLN